MNLTMNITCADLDVKDSCQYLDIGSPVGTHRVSMAHIAVTVGDLTRLRQLNHDDDVASSSTSWPEKDNRMTCESYSLLHLACRYGHLDIVRYLLRPPRRGPWINQRDKQGGFTPLFYAVLFKHTDVVVSLLEAGAEVSCQSNNGSTVLKIAEAQGWKAMTTLLQASTTAVATTKEDPPLGIRQWLSAIDLDVYTEGFVQAGYEDLEFLREHGKLEDADLDAIGVTKPGHRKKLAVLYKLPPKSNTPGSEYAEASEPSTIESDRDRDSSSDGDEESETSSNSDSSEDGSDSSGESESTNRSPNSSDSGGDGLEESSDEDDSE